MGERMPYTSLADIHKIEFVATAECDNPYCIFDLHNNITILDNIKLTDYKAGDVLFSLPEQMWPSKDIVHPIVCTTGTAFSSWIEFNTEGEVALNADIASGTVFTNGLVFNISGKYYNETIGNVDKSKFTQPLWSE